MGDRMNVDGGNNISLDGILQAERRKQARGNTNNGAGRGRGGRDNRMKSRNSSGISTPPGNPNGKWTHDLFSAKGVPNPMASRVTKTPVGGKSANNKAIAITPTVAKQLANNPLFAAIAGTPTNNNNNNSGKKQVNKVPSLSEIQKKKGSIDIGASIRGTANTQKEIPRGPAADRRNNGNNASGSRSFNGIPTGPSGNVGASIRGAASGGVGVSIRGAAGPFVVHISNLAPGTTADDVTKVMAEIGKVRFTAIIQVTPTTVAEVLFEKREAAQACVSRFNGLKADGLILRVQIYDGPPVTQSKPSVGAARDDAYSVQREMANLQRLAANNNGVIQDGTFGFQSQPSLYSDAIVKRGRGFQR